MFCPHVHDCVVLLLSLQISWPRAYRVQLRCHGSCGTTSVHSGKDWDVCSVTGRAVLWIMMSLHSAKTFPTGFPWKYKKDFWGALKERSERHEWSRSETQKLWWHGRVQSDGLQLKCLHKTYIQIQDLKTVMCRSWWARKMSSVKWPLAGGVSLKK